MANGQRCKAGKAQRPRGRAVFLFICTFAPLLFGHFPFNPRAAPKPVPELADPTCADGGAWCAGPFITQMPTGQDGWYE